MVTSLVWAGCLCWSVVTVLHFFSDKVLCCCRNESVDHASRSWAMNCRQHWHTWTSSYLWSTRFSTLPLIWQGSQRGMYMVSLTLLSEFVSPSALISSDITSKPSNGTLHSTVLPSYFRLLAWRECCFYQLLSEDCSSAWNLKVTASWVRSWCVGLWIGFWFSLFLALSSRAHTHTHARTHARTRSLTHRSAFFLPNAYLYQSRFLYLCLTLFMSLAIYQPYCGGGGGGGGRFPCQHLQIWRFNEPDRLAMVFAANHPTTWLWQLLEAWLKICTVDKLPPLPLPPPPPFPSPAHTF